MGDQPVNNQPDPFLLELSAELFLLRDAMIQMSEILVEYLLEKDSPERDEVMAKVERYLCKLKE